jgi:hypothetical protein
MNKLKQMKKWTSMKGLADAKISVQKVCVSYKVTSARKSAFRLNFFPHSGEVR